MRSGASRPTADALLLSAEKKYKTGSAVTDPHDETLGTGQYLLDRLTGWFRGVTRIEALRRALKDWLKDDKTFDIKDRDETCKDVLASVGQGIHFLVTGHTHLERAIDLGGGRFYKTHDDRNLGPNGMLTGSSPEIVSTIEAPSAASPQWQA